MAATPPAAGGSPGRSALDVHEGFDPPRVSGGCKRWPKALRLRDRGGALVMGRCGATNLCEYCSQIEAVVQAELLALDAMEGNAPSVWCVLTTSDTAAQWDAERYRRSMGKVLRAVKRRFPDAEYVCIVEFTTGYAERSGGKRRPHWNMLWKNIDPAELDELRSIILGVWCMRENAVEAAQWTGTVAEFGGLMRYLTLHFLKESQRPPNGWSGKRVRMSRGYCSRPRWQLRRDAEASLKLKRELWKAENRGLEGQEALVVAEASAVINSTKEWELVHVTVNQETGEVSKLSTLQNRTPRTMLGVPRSTPLAVGMFVKNILMRDRERLGDGVPSVDVLLASPEGHGDLLPRRA